MSAAPHPFRGPLFMVLATGSYTINDTMMKVATAGLPPYEVLMLRGVAATLIGLPLLLAMGFGRDLPKLVDRWVLLRSLCETLGVLCWMTALTHMLIADATALGQITPLLVLLGSSLLFREKIGGVRMALIGLGFAGALLVAQPTMQGISLYALLALANAVLCAARDIAGRKVSGAVPGMIVAYCAVLMVAPAAAGMHLLTEHWVTPDWPNAALLVGAGVFVIFGHRDVSDG